MSAVRWRRKKEARDKRVSERRGNKGMREEKKKIEANSCGE